VTGSAAAARVRSFYAALNEGDGEQVAAHLAEGATDDRGEAGPVAGPTAIAAARLGGGRPPAVSWTLESLIAGGPVVATECTVTWNDEDGELVAERASEWFTLREGLIEAIRSYPGPEDPATGSTFTDEDFDWSLLETDDDL